MDTCETLSVDTCETILLKNIFDNLFKFYWYIKSRSLLVKGVHIKFCEAKYWTFLSWVKRRCEMLDRLQLFELS